MSSEGEDAGAMRKELDSLKDGREKEAEEGKDKEMVAPHCMNVDNSDAGGDTTDACLELRMQLETEKLSHDKSRLEWNALKKDLETKLENMRARSNENETVLENMEVENNKLTEQNDNFAETIESFNKSSVKVKNEHAIAVQELEGSIKSLKAKEDDRNTQLIGHTGEDSTASEISVLKTQNEELSLQLLKQKDEVEKAHREMEALRKSQAESDERGKKYVAVLNKTKKQILKLEKEKLDATDEVAMLQSELTETKAVLSNAGKKEESISAISSKLQNSILERDAEIADQRSRLHQQESELTILRKERKEANHLKIQAEDELQLKMAQYESSQNRVAHLEIRLKESEQQYEELHQRIGVLEELVASSEQHVNRLKSNEEMLTKKSNNDLSVMQQRLDEVTNRLTSDRENVEQIKLANEKERSDKLKQIEQLQLELHSTQAQLQDLNSALLERTTALNDAKNHVASLKSSLAGAENKVEDLSTNLTQMSKELNQLKDWAGTIRKEKEEIERQLEESRMKETHFKSMNKTLKDEIKRFTRGTPVSQAGTSAASSRSASPSMKASSPNTIPDQSNLHNGQPVANDPSMSHSISNVNLEYLKHIIIGFIENRQTRNQLIPVLSMLLKLNTEEVKRLQAAS